MAFSGIEEFLKAHNTTLQAVEAAYKAAEEDFLQAHAARRTPVLIHAIEPPRVKNDRYAAVTGPLGYNSTPINEPVWQGSIVHGVEEHCGVRCTYCTTYCILYKKEFFGLCHAVFILILCRVPLCCTKVCYLLSGTARCCVYVLQGSVGIT